MRPITIYGVSNAMKLYKPQIIFASLLIVLMMAGCVAPSAAPASSESAAAEQTAGEAEMPVADPEDSVDTPITDLPITATLTTTAEVSVGAALSARQILAQRLQLPLDAITIVSAEAVEWPDGCLGVAAAGVMCMQVITPGYRVTLETQGDTYVFHTDEAGGQVRLASAPEPQIEAVALVWQQEEMGMCNSATIGAQQIAFGPCEGPLASAPLIEEMGRPAELAEFVQAYAPFEAETAAGAITFTGTGTTVATPAEQRMLAEWARLVFLEAQGGRSGAVWGLVFAWHREGGIAGFCDDVTVYVTGQVYVTSCKGNQTEAIGKRRLTADELAQIYTWVDELQSFEFDQKDAAVADAMQVQLTFSGAGERVATPEEQQAMQDFAATMALDTAQ